MYYFLSNDCSRDKSAKLVIVTPIDFSYSPLRLGQGISSLVSHVKGRPCCPFPLRVTKTSASVMGLQEEYVWVSLCTTFPKHDHNISTEMASSSTDKETDREMSRKSGRE